MDGRAVAVVEGGKVFFVRTDHIGRPVFATDSDGLKVWEASYLPFGGVHVSTGAINLRFPGQWYQSESGLHQNWMRDYDPTTGRYLQADPLGLVDGASVYGYALGNPGRWVDPFGLFKDTYTPPHQRRNAMVETLPFGGGGGRSSSASGTGLAAVIAAMVAGATDPSMSVPGSGAATQQCEPCPPCTPYPIGTVGFQGPEVGERGRDAGIPHYHLFEVQQIPTNCRCIWREATKRLVGHHHAYSPLGTVNLTGRGRPPPYP
jgi:RHS repeat-associated protein